MKLMGAANPGPADLKPVVEVQFHTKADRRQICLMAVHTRNLCAKQNSDETVVQ